MSSNKNPQSEGTFTENVLVNTEDLSGSTANVHMSTPAASLLTNFTTISEKYLPSFPSSLNYNDFWNFNEEFDLLWKSFFDNNSVFKPIREKIASHPCDIRETNIGLKIELAAVGLDKEEISIIVDSETLRVAYLKTESENQEERYLHRSIKKASFDIAWKISSKYDLTNVKAGLDKGLLTLNIPFAKENKPKKVTIK